MVAECAIQEDQETNVAVANRLREPILGPTYEHCWMIRIDSLEHLVESVRAGGEPKSRTRSGVA